MKCPVCKDVTLLMTEKHGIEVDYCPECRGVWLDRGELDKIIERARDARDYDERRDDRRAYDDRRSSSRDGYRYDHDHKHDYKKKKSSPISALSDIMEIFGGE